MTATQQRPDWWRDEFRSLDGLPLLPCGAGDSKKAPFPSNWQNLSFSLDEVMEALIKMRANADTLIEHGGSQENWAMYEDSLMRHCHLFLKRRKAWQETRGW